MAASVYSRTLQKASDLAGGHLKLCRYLKVPSTDLADWINDKSSPPLAIFLKAVDLVLDEASSGGGSDPGDPPAPRDASAPPDSSTQY